METLIYRNGDIEIKAKMGTERIYDRDACITINGKEFIRISSHDINNFKDDLLKIIDEYMIVK